MCAAKTATGVGLEAPQCEGWPKKCLRLRIAVWLTEVWRHRTGLLHGSIVHSLTHGLVRGLHKEHLEVKSVGMNGFATLNPVILLWFCQLFQLSVADVARQFIVSVIEILEVCVFCGKCGRFPRQLWAQKTCILSSDGKFACG